MLRSGSVHCPTTKCIVCHNQYATITETTQARVSSSFKSFYCLIKLKGKETRKLTPLESLLLNEHQLNININRPHQTLTGIVTPSLHIRAASRQVATTLPIERKFKVDQLPNDCNQIDVILSVVNTSASIFFPLLSTRSRFLTMTSLSSTVSKLNTTSDRKN